MIDVNNNKNGKRSVQIVFILVVAIVVLISVINTIRVNTSGRYVLGKLYKIERGGPNAATSYFYYFFKGRRYIFKVTDGGSRDSLIFLKLLSKDPTIVRPHKEIQVPSCIKFNEVPDSGWRKIPNVVCP